MTVTDAPDPALRDALVRGIRTFESRRRRRRRAVGGAALVLVGVAVAALAVSSGAGDEVGTADDPAVDTTATVPGPTDGRVEVQVIDPLATEGTDLVGADVVLLATNGNGGGVALADLSTNRRAVVEGATGSIDGFTGGAVSGGLITDTHVLLGPPAIALVTPGHDRIGALAGGALDEPRQLEHQGPVVRRAVATDDGGGIWLYSRGDAAQTSLRLVDADLETVVELAIPGGLLVDVIGDDAVVDLSLPEGEGGVLVVSPDGSTREIARPDGAGFVTATPVRTVWARPVVRPTELVVVDSDGAERTVPAPVGRTWVGVAHPTIPSDSGPLKSVTRDGTTLLLGLHDPGVGENGQVTDLVTVDVARGEIDEVIPLTPYGASQLSAAFWSADDNRIVAVVGMDEGQGVMWTEPGSGLVQGIGDVFPRGYFVIAAR